MFRTVDPPQITEELDDEILFPARHCNLRRNSSLKAGCSASMIRLELQGH